MGSFHSMYNKIIDTVWHRKLWIKSLYNSKNLCECCRLYCVILWAKTVLTSPDQNVSLALDHNVLIFLVTNMYNGNIWTFRHRTLCKKTWYSSKYLWILPIFLVYFLDKICANTLNIHTIYEIKVRFLDLSFSIFW